MYNVQTTLTLSLTFAHVMKSHFIISGFKKTFSFAVIKSVDWQDSTPVSQYGEHVENEWAQMLQDDLPLH